MGKVNNVVNSKPADSDKREALKVSMQDILDSKRNFVEQNMSLSREEFAALFGKKVDWALDRMRDGSVVVLDEFAKKGANGVIFSKHARICACSVKSYRDSLAVPIV
jgi:hypothetical protein